MSEYKKAALRSIRESFGGYDEKPKKKKDKKKDKKPSKDLGEKIGSRFAKLMSNMKK